ncbi:peptidoglycan-binding domain-containing protein [Streptomyces sp. YIM S03343]
MPTPSEPGQPPDRPVLEPIRVLRLRRTDALAELMKDMPRGGYESVPVPPSRQDPGPRGRRTPGPGSEHGRTTGPDVSYSFEDETQELPPVPPAPGGPRLGSGPGLRRAAIAVGVAAAALVGFGCALLLPARSDATTVRPSATARPSAEPTSAPAETATPAGGSDPDGVGTLRRGDSGPEVAELQQRLLRIPDVYKGGSTSGRYDATLTAAVARFQLWYGIRGDETGVYGNDTRQSLESRTTLDGG